MISTIISTNKVKPKDDMTFARFLREETDEKGEPTGNIISTIPRRVITTSQKKFVERPKFELPHNFPPARRVKRPAPERTFIQAADLRGIEEKRKQKMEPKIAAAKKARGRPKRKR